MKLQIIDTHCDALYKLQREKLQSEIAERENTFRFESAIQLDTNLQRLKAGNICVQFFAIFLEPNIPSDLKWHYALEQVDIFYEEILAKHPEMKHIKIWNDLEHLREGEIGAVLALEGADCIGNDLMKLRHLYRLGVMSFGLTWNNANLCADGVGEDRAAGLSNLGKEVVQLNNEFHVLTDVSHLTEKGFWDVMEIADYPIASHSNALAVCNHPRNLTDEQIKAMFNKGGMVHVVFNPPFINEGRESATIDDLIAHIDHLCSLGGVDKIGFGSDFDGIEQFVDGLENASKYPNLIEELLKKYSEDEVKGFAYRNFLKNRPR